ncbi:SusC/RagA family TonB-linked outer membrane protein [Flavobacterium alkalisoli]|uniref:SusC/RagA family TonB-linked outer membrane protein n=1 Tax=Flavobacterium alkalisoli TaxID=2602769 RepID=UPI003A8F2399
MKNFILGVFLMLGGYITYAQEITGKVVDESGLPIPDVYIVATQSNTSTVADLDGNFTITAKEGEPLTFSMLGFDTMTVNASTGMSVTLKPSADSTLEEVVVVGYGTTKRSDLTGAVGTVKAEQFAKQPQYNAMGSIQGKIAGVNIINNDAPGATPTVRVRGLGTAVGGSSPLYVVDGIVVGSIDNINPGDILTMDVLKDASSAAIYGSNAANGVILITTKKGKSGAMKISASSSYAVKSLLNKVEMANSSQYVTYFNENLTFQGRTSGFLQENQPYDTDWLDETTDLGKTTINSIAISGGSDNADYYVSYNNYSEDGILDNQKIARNTLRSNTSFKVLDNRLKLSQNVTYAHTRINPKPFGAFNDAYRQAPIVPTHYDNGAFGQAFYNTTTGMVGYVAGDGESIGRLNSIGNPLANVYYQNEETNVDYLQGMFDAELKVTNWLKVNSRLGLTKSFAKTRTFSDIKGIWLTNDPTRTEQQFIDNQIANPESVTWANNSLEYKNVESFRYNWDTFFTINKSFENHNFTVIGGITKDKRNDVYTARVKDWNVPYEEQYWNIDQSQGYTAEASQFYSTPIHLLSYFGRVEYNYNEKYLVTANIRRDGNSNFKENAEYWGTFPSFSAGWVLSKEDFLSNVSFVNFLKIRGGYGEIGNASVPFNLTTLRSGNNSGSYNYVLGPNQDMVFGSYYSSPALPISWETTKEWNAGVDFELLNRRLTGSLDYYHRLTDGANLLINPVLNSAASTAFYDEACDILNEGFEIGLNWRDTLGDDFNYFIGGTFANNKNTVQNVKPAYDGYTGGSLANGQITKRLTEGQPIYSWWMYEADGVWQTQEEIDANPHIAGAQPGHLKYKDQNGDGRIDDADKKTFGSYIPTFTYGINIGFNYKNIDFSVDGYGVGGNKVYNGLKGTRIDGGENFPVDMFDGRWTGPGTSNSTPGANRDSRASSYYLEDGDYFRINNITVGYTFRELFKGIESVRVYGTAQNPFLFTKYSGFTPEINSNGLPGETTGIELSAYPNTKSFIFGVSLTL